MKKRRIVLAALAVVVVLVAAIGSSLAYFSAFVTASGTVTVGAGTTTTIEEPDVSEGTKHLVITNTGENDCYVRAKAFAGSALTLTYSGSGWTDRGDGWYYYGEILPAGEQTSELLVTISGEEDLAEDVDSFNVIVVYEHAPVSYDENGNAFEDWNLTIDGEGGQS